MRVTLVVMIMQVVGGGGVPEYAEYPPRSLEPTGDPRKWNVAMVQDWVESTGFYEYRNAFAEASIDGKHLLGMTAANLREEVLVAKEHAHVLAMEIGELGARHGLGNRPLPRPENWDVQRVGKFLTESGLEKFAARFVAAQIDGRKFLSLTTPQIGLITASEALRDRNEEEESAAAELLGAMVDHLRWRSGLGKVKDEL